MKFKRIFFVLGCLSVLISGFAGWSQETKYYSLEIGQTSELGFKFLASTDEVWQINVSVVSHGIPVEAASGETGYFGRIYVSTSGRENLAIRPFDSGEYLQIGQTSELGFKPFASVEEARKISVFIGSGWIPVEVMSGEIGYFGRIYVSTSGRENLAVRLSKCNKPPVVKSPAAAAVTEKKEESRKVNNGGGLGALLSGLVTAVVLIVGAVLAISFLGGVMAGMAGYQGPTKKESSPQAFHVNQSGQNFVDQACERHQRLVDEACEHEQRRSESEQRRLRQESEREERLAAQAREREERLRSQELDREQRRQDQERWRRGR